MFKNSLVSLPPTRASLSQRLSFISTVHSHKEIFIKFASSTWFTQTELNKNKPSIRENSNRNHLFSWTWNCWVENKARRISRAIAIEIPDESLMRFWWVATPGTASSPSARGSMCGPWNGRCTRCPLQRSSPCAPVHTSSVLALVAANRTMRMMKQSQLPWVSWLTPIPNENKQKESAHKIYEWIGDNVGLIWILPHHPCGP